MAVVVVVVVVVDWSGGELVLGRWEWMVSRRWKGWRRYGESKTCSIVYLTDQRN